MSNKSSAKKRNKKIPFIPKPPRTLETAIANFHEVCEKCKEPLEVIKFLQGGHKRQEVITATCFNKKFKDMDCKCENYCLPVIFRYCKWF